jgi:DNA replication protein DnaC
MAARRLAQLRGMSQMTGLERMTFASFDTNVRGIPSHKQSSLRWAYEEANAFAQHPDGWLLIKGGYGCGKTHLAAAIANACVERGQPVLFKTVPDLLDHLRATYGPSSPTHFDETFERVRTAPVLILDDLGTESSTAWAQEKLFQIFNHRYNLRLPTVITTNHELEEISLRLRSRLADPDVTRIVAITAPDYRRAGIAQDQSDLSSLALHSRQTFESFSLRADELTVEEAENLKRALRSASLFADDPQGWFMLTGTYGCGKTHLAAAIANHRADLGYPALFILVPDLLDHLRATFNPQSTTTFDVRFEEIRRTPFLVMDDLGTESATPWAREKLYQVFDYRYNARLPTVITTATPLEELDPRLASRMLDTGRCTVFAIIAPPFHHRPSPPSTSTPGRRARRR